MSEKEIEKAIDEFERTIILVAANRPQKPLSYEKHIQCLVKLANARKHLMELISKEVKHE